MSERKMFGGLAFMLRGNMCCGVVGDDLMLRVGPERYDDALARRGARPMDFTGRPMKGMVYVESTAVATDAKLREWLEVALGFAGELPAK
jgi:TfoX/Sxy family transcriptional regulator of competence genes